MPHVDLFAPAGFGMLRRGRSDNDVFGSLDSPLKRRQFTPISGASDIFRQDGVDQQILT